MSAGAVPIRESVGGALRYVRENLRFVTTVALAFAVVSTLLSALTLAMPQVSIITMVANGLVQAFSFGALLVGALYGADTVRGRWSQDGFRVWSAMVVIAFFMFIIMFGVFMVVSMVLFAGPLSPYIGELQAAGSDETRVMSLLTRIGTEQPLPLLLAALFCGAVWLLFTSRLYLAAPASVAAGRILTFETWKWTKGAMFGISAARFMLLIPAYVLMFALTMLLGRVFGFSILDGASMQQALSANPVGIIIFEFVSSFIVLALYASLEAGLSAYLYNGLKPADATAASPRPAV